MMKLLLAVPVVVLVAGRRGPRRFLLVVMKGQQRVPVCRSAQALDEGEALLRRRPRRLPSRRDPDRRPVDGLPRLRRVGELQVEVA